MSKNCRPTKCLISFIVVLCFCFIGSNKSADADLITLNDTTPSGNQNRASFGDFVGILDGVSPNSINGSFVFFLPTVPGSESFQVGDLVGSDLNASGGGRNWVYEIILPANAIPGTGLTDIAFNAHAFERTQNNLEGNDQVTWTLFFNNDFLTPIASSTPGVGVDWTSFDASLMNAGGNSITSVQVMFTVNGFNANNEWFVTRGQLSANYQSIPEPVSMTLLLMMAVSSIFVGKLRLAR